MLQELQKQGYYVQAKPALRSKIRLGVGNGNEQFMSIEDSNVFPPLDVGIHKRAEERPDDEDYTLDFR